MSFLFEILGLWALFLFWLVGAGISTVSRVARSTRVFTHILTNRTTGVICIIATSIRPAGFLLLLLPLHGWAGSSPLPYSSWVWCLQSPTGPSRNHCTVGGIQEKVIIATALGIFLRWEHPLLRWVAEALRGRSSVASMSKYLCIVISISNPTIICTSTLLEYNNKRSFSEL